MRLSLALLAAAGAALLAAPASAHHSFASFDLSRVVRIEGTVVEFQWTNPHAWAEVDVTNPEGGVDRWSVEFNSPNNLTREGWNRHMLEAGDHVTFFIHPMRDGRHGGFYYEVVLDDGRSVTVQMTPFNPPEGFNVDDSPSAYEASADAAP